MDDRERQRMEYKERNEKNKVWQKRIKIYYTVAWGTLLLEILLVSVFFMDPTHSKIWLYVMGVLFVMWFVWVIAGNLYIRCPHCDSIIAHMALKASHCPYCGTKLDVFPDLESPKEGV